MIIDFLFFILAGAIMGFLSGLLGIGGGVIVVPSLYFIFLFLDYPDDLLMHLAIGTSLATMIITSLVSAVSHNKKRAVLWSLSRIIAPGILVGSVLGALLAHFISSDILTKIFGIFAVLLGFYFLLPKAPKFHFDHPSKFWLSSLGLLIGSLATMLGIGGGVVAVPVLMGFNVPVKNAVATSSSLTFFTALIGSISYAVIGFGSGGKDTFGYVYLPAFFLMGLTAVFLTPLGVKLAHRLPTKVLKRIFAICLMITGVSMLSH